MFSPAAYQHKKMRQTCAAASSASSPTAITWPYTCSSRINAVSANSGNTPAPALQITSTRGEKKQKRSQTLATIAVAKSRRASSLRRLRTTKTARGLRLLRIRAQSVDTKQCPVAVRLSVERKKNNYSTDLSFALTATNASTTLSAFSQFVVQHLTQIGQLSKSHQQPQIEQQNN